MSGGRPGGETPAGRFLGGGGDANEEQLKGSEGVQYVEVQCSSVTPTLQHKATTGEKLGCCFTS